MAAPAVGPKSSRRLSAHARRPADIGIEASATLPQRSAHARDEIVNSEPRQSARSPRRCPASSPRSKWSTRKLLLAVEVGRPSRLPARYTDWACRGNRPHGTRRPPQAGSGPRSGPAACRSRTGPSWPVFGSAPFSVGVLQPGLEESEGSVSGRLISQTTRLPTCETPLGACRDSGRANTPKRRRSRNLGRGLRRRSRHRGRSATEETAARPWWVTASRCARHCAAAVGRAKPVEDVVLDLQGEDVGAVRRSRRPSPAVAARCSCRAVPTVPARQAPVTARRAVSWRSCGGSPAQRGWPSRGLRLANVGSRLGTCRDGRACKKKVYHRRKRCGPGWTARR